MRRIFNHNERLAAYLASNGDCEQCGQDLRFGYHADHVIPYSSGGATELTNIAALCPTCNLSKGNKMLVSTTFPEWSQPMRKWQERAWNAYQEKTKQSFLAVATPGAGKTTFALRVAYESLRTDTVKRIVIVAPTRHLCTQWSLAASKVGINLVIYNNKRMNEPRDSHGIITTYQSVSSSPEQYAVAVHKRATLTILDEAHHGSDENAWGESLRTAFDGSASVLALSGTPFRSDNRPIPFVTYDDNGVCVADYQYSYARALEDGICRTVYFPTFEGDISWLEDDEYREVTFTDDLTKELSRRRLNMAVKTPDYLHNIALRAHADLQTLRRQQQSNAGGLLIASDIHEARNACKSLANITGVKPVLVTSDDENATHKIKQFADSNDAWIVAVRMISEGVDIPRLRVLLYFTNYTSALFFHQAIGRVVRMMPSVQNALAFVYMPKDPELHALARSVIKERNDVVNFQQEPPALPSDSDDDSDEWSPVCPPSRLVLTPCTGNAVMSDTVYMGDNYDGTMATVAEEYADKHGVPAPVLQVVLADFAQKRQSNQNQASPYNQCSYDEQIRDQKELLNNSVRKLAKKLLSRIYTSDDISLVISRIWARIYEQYPPINDASLSDLQHMRKRVAQLDNIKMW